MDGEPSHAVEKILESGISQGAVPNADWYLAPPEPLPTPPHATMSAALTHAAARAGVGIHLLGEQPDDATETRTYADIERASRRLAQRLVQRGVSPGDRVLMVLPTSYDFIVTFFAVQRAGAIPVPTYPPALMERAEQAIERMSHIAAKVQARFVMTSERLKPLLGELGLRLRCMREIWTGEQLCEGVFDPADPGPAPRDPMPDDVAFIQFTSGSTGNPKGVVIPHRAAVANTYAMGIATGTREDDIACGWVPLYHDMGLIGALFTPAYFRYQVVLMSPTAFLLRPRRWLEAITHYRATLTASPNFGFAMCVRRVRPAERKGLDLSSWRLAYNGAESISMRTVVDFTKAYEPYGFRMATMFPVYGLAENTLAVTYAPPGEPFKYRNEHKHAVVCVGKPIPGQEVRIVDAAGKALPEREVGEIITRGPSMMRGYYEDPTATAQAIRDGWLWTGDLGFVSNGGLYISGRSKDLIIIRGHNYYAEDLERVAERIDGVRGGCVVAFPIDEGDGEAVVMVCETRLRDAAKAELSRQIAERVQEICGLRVQTVVMVQPGTVPKTSSGKRQRDLCKQLYLEDNLRPRRTSKVGLAMVFIRSGLGFVAQRLRRARR